LGDDTLVANQPPSTDPVWKCWHPYWSCLRTSICCK